MNWATVVSNNVNHLNFNLLDLKASERMSDELIRLKWSFFSPSLLFDFFTFFSFSPFIFAPFFVGGGYGPYRMAFVCACESVCCECEFTFRLSHSTLVIFVVAVWRFFFCFFFSNTILRFIYACRPYAARNA